MNSKKVNPVICVVLLAVAAATSLSTQSDVRAHSGSAYPNSVARANVKIHCAEDVSAEVAGRLADYFQGDVEGSGTDLELYLRGDAEHYIITVFIDSKLKKNFRANGEIICRVVSDYLELDRPLAYEYRGSDFVEIVQALPPLGKQTEHNGDFLYTSENMDASEIQRAVKGLESTGMFVEDQNKMFVQVIKQDAGYTLKISLDENAESRIENFMELMKEDTKVYRDSYFGGATTKLVGTLLNFEPIKGFEWVAEGDIPDRQQIQLDNVVVSYEGGITREMALAVAERFPTRGHQDKTLGIELSLRDGVVECRQGWNAEFVKNRSPMLLYFLRETFSAVRSEADIDSMHMIIGDQGEELKTMEITLDHGDYKDFGQNRLNFPYGTKQELIEEIKEGLNVTGLFTSESNFAARYTTEVEGGVESNVLRFAVSPPSLRDQLKPDLPAVAQMFAETAFPGQPLRFEYTDYGFEPSQEYGWSSNGDEIAAE